MLGPAPRLPQCSRGYFSMDPSDKPTARNDVRMRGFVERTRVETALAWVDQHAPALPAELIPVEQAHARVLAQDAVAQCDVPSFARSAMDGYALRGLETVGAGDYNPLSFRILGDAFPARPYLGEVLAGTAVRIMTGAPLPAGADAVLPAEFAQEAGGQVAALGSVSPGKHVGQIGEDVAAGRVVAERGRRLRPQDVGLLASVGLAEVSVIRKPRIRILATGNELVAPGEPRSAFQIVDSNSSMLAALVARDGGVVASLYLLPDDREALRQQLLAAGADVILISGGSSVGAEDHAPTLIAAEGELAIHGVAMRPSSPAGMGRVGGGLVFLLPGNPVSCLSAYDFFAGRAIRRLGGRSPDWPYVCRQFEVGRKFVSAVGRVDYVRVRIVDGRAEPLGLSGASILSSTTRADGFVVIPAEFEGYAPGSVLNVYLYDPV